MAHDNLEVQYESTGSMWSDVLTKPKHGEAFRVLRRYLMNVLEEYGDEVERLNTYLDLLPSAEDDSKLLVSNRVVLDKPFIMTKRTVSFAETVPTMTTCTMTMTTRVLKRVSTPQTHHMNVLGKYGTTAPYASKLAGACT